MGLFSKMAENATRDWAKNLTPEQIAEYERQGLDMSEYKIINEEHRAEQQRMADAIDLSMLDKFKKSRSADFVDAVAKFNKLSDKKKKKLEEAPLVYGKVVQAHYTLFTPNPKNKDGAGIVFLYAKDDAHCYDDEWLTNTVNRILEMVESAKNQPETKTEKIARLLGLKNSFLFSMTVGSKEEKKKVQFLPEDCRELIQILSSDTSRFCLKLGPSLSDGADAWCGTYALWDQSKLPMAQIPQNRIIPLLLTYQPQGYGGIEDDAQLIPPAYYTK